MGIFKWLNDTVPKWLKAVFGIILVSAFDRFFWDSNIFKFLFTSQLPAFLQYSWTITVLIFTIIILGILLRYSHKNKTHSAQQSENPEVRDDLLKPLKSPAYLDTYSTKDLTWDIIVKFDFDPKNKPHLKDFTNKIHITEKPVCSMCGAEAERLWLGRERTWGYECPKYSNEHFQMSSSIYKELNSRILKIVKGETKDNFDGYWKKYKEELDRATDGNIDKFKFSWR